jgi:NADH-quinone oxidoreductase subunit A
MPAKVIDAYMPVLILMVFAVVMVVGAMFVGSFLRPNNPSKEKSTPYECGEAPIGEAWMAFNVRFYVVGLIFIIFDVESVLMFPVVAVYKKLVELGEGATAFAILLLFISVLLEGIVYCWKKGDLDWLRSFQQVKENK